MRRAGALCPWCRGSPHGDVGERQVSGESPYSAAEAVEEGAACSTHRGVSKMPAVRERGKTSSETFPQTAAFRPEKRLEFSPRSACSEPTWMHQQTAAPLQVSTKKSLFLQQTTWFAAALPRLCCQEALPPPEEFTAPRGSSTARQPEGHVLLGELEWAKDEGRRGSQLRFFSPRQTQVEAPTERVNATAPPDFCGAGNAELAQRNRAECGGSASL